MPELTDWSTSRLLTTAARLVDHAWNTRLLDLGMTHAGYTTLGVLANHEAMTAAKLALAIRVQAQTIGRTLDKLERHGFITRIRDTEDRRRQRVAITSLGLSSLLTARDIESSLMAGEGLESAELRSLLKAVVRELGPQRSDAPAHSGDPESRTLLSVAG